MSAFALCTYQHPSLSIEGRLPTLSSAVPPRTLLAKIPLGATLSSQALLRLESWASLASFGAGAISGDDLLSLFIVSALASPKRSDTTAKFAPFLQNWPASYTSPVLFLPPSLPHLLLSHTAVGGMAARLRDQMARDHERLVDLLERHKAMHGGDGGGGGSLPEPEELTLDAYVTALLGVYSRGTDIDLRVEGGKGERQRLLVPVLDMFNHSSDSLVSHEFNPDSLCVEIRTGAEEVPAGEVLLNYGALGNQTLLQFYGFTVAGNESDTADLYIPLSPQLPLYERKLGLLGRLFPEFDWGGSGVHVLNRGGALEESLLGVLRIMPVADEQTMESLEREGAEGLRALGEAYERGALGALSGALRGMSQAIALDLLEVYVESELQILSETLAVVEEKIDALDRDIDDVD
ncbi:hypothetical protein TeGR_g6158 [Tetraparma gracilis]|uniref:SET domain-containing protein n=1 Tax=Tetraparma gracilis TaxID=2962635 RepID=A0ABQ6MBN4_9STRA|nr:hypothetical protein TeGR_g6158 [Tetraparma gracilis]